MTPLTLRFDASPSGWVLLGNRDPPTSFRRRHPVGNAASFQQLRKSSITVLRHMLASMKTRREKSGEFFLPDLTLQDGLAPGGWDVWEIAVSAGEDG